MTSRYGLTQKFDIQGVPMETARRATFLIDKSGKWRVSVWSDWMSSFWVRPYRLVTDLPIAEDGETDSFC